MDNINIVYAESNENKKVGWHFHNSYEIILVIEGKVRIDINLKNYEVCGGSMVFISHLESHEISVIDYPYKRYFILIEPGKLHNLISDNRLTSILKKRPDGFNHVVKLDKDEIDIFKTMFADMHYEYNHPHDFSSISISALLQLFFVRLYQNHDTSFPSKNLKGSAGVINDVQQYIDDHYLEPVNLNEISRLFYLDMYYLSHLFKKVCGYSMKDYLILQRISKAKELLVSSDKSVSMVCSDSGFGNINHFIRIFKKNEGITPFQYKKKYKA